MTGVEDAIARVPMFSGLSKKDRQSLASSLRERTFSAGTVITDVGKEGIGFFIIDAGTATVLAGGEERRSLKAGDYFGEIALLDEGTRTAKVTAETDLKCYGLTAWEFRPFVQNHPDVAWALLQSLAKRVREAEARP